MPEMPLSIADAAQKLAQPFTHTVLGQVDNYCAYLSRFKGSYRLHQHEKDEMYVILEGTVDIDYEDGSTTRLAEGDTLVVKAKQVHRSRSDEGALVLMFKAAHLFAE
jgi:mannose-6-phosphate isomerase-like protein (cupin superfamily)